MTLAHDRELGLREQWKQVGAWGDEADFDDSISHRDHIFDRAERVLERIPAARGELALKQPRDLLGSDLRLVGPFGRRDAEDIAHAVVADVPPLGKAADDIAARIEADEALRNVLQEYGVGGRERSRRGVGQPRLAANDHDPGLAFHLRLAGAGRELEAGE